MKYLVLAAASAVLLWPRAAAAYEGEGPSYAASVASDTANGADDEDDQTAIQENDEDLADFVTDYIRRDIQLKGGFFMEDGSSGKVLKLQLISVEKAVSEDTSETGAKIVTAVFRDAAGKKFQVAFHLQNGPWGGLDIFKLDLKVPGRRKPVKAGK